MRLSVSNIAWPIEREPEIADMLRGLGIDAVDVAPGKYWPDLTRVSDREAADKAAWWRERGFTPVGMQSLLFGTTGLNVFGPTEQRERMLAHLRAVCRIGAVLGARRLVFGSPKNRDRAGLDDRTTHERALDFFTRLGDIARTEGVQICLEPNPPVYGANFLTTTPKCLAFVRELAHPAVRMQLDTGTLWINDEPDALIAEALPFVGHIHISEPGLAPIGTKTERHPGFARVLAAHADGAVAALEMLTPPEAADVAAVVRQAARFAQALYQGQCPEEG